MWTAKIEYNSTKGWWEYPYYARFYDNSHYRFADDYRYSDTFRSKWGAERYVKKTLKRLNSKPAVFEYDSNGDLITESQNTDKG